MLRLRLSITGANLVIGIQPMYIRIIIWHNAHHINMCTCVVCTKHTNTQCISVKQWIFSLKKILPHEKKMCVCVWLAANEWNRGEKMKWTRVCSFLCWKMVFIQYVNAYIYIIIYVLKLQKDYLKYFLHTARATRTISQNMYESIV